MKKAIKTRAIPVTVLFLAALMAFTAILGRFGLSAAPANAAVNSSGSSLSLAEINDEFGVMVLRATMNKTLIYVDRLYFDYSPLSSNRLNITKNEDTDYVVIDIENEAGEWAKVWGYVRQTEGVRPDDSLKRIATLNYLEIKSYWEWRNFSNEERWSIRVRDGYHTVDMTFDLGDRKDAAVYYIDGVYGLPEHYYPQVCYWWDVTSLNPELMEIRDYYRERALELAVTTPEDEPIRLQPTKYTGSGIKTSPTAAHNGGRTVAPMFSNKNAQAVAPFAAGMEPGMNSGEMDADADPAFFWVVAAVVIVVVVAVVVVCMYKEPNLAPETTPSNITDAYDPAQRNDDTPPAPTQEQREEYNEYVEENPLTVEEKEELERYKEFSIENDVPAGQKLVKLKVKDADGVLQPVYDENGGEIFVNRVTYTVGNQTYALINRETLLLIRWYPSTLELKDIVGNRITVNVDRRIMNMDGIEPYSPRSRDDILSKMGSMGMYTSSIDPARMLFRMDDNEALKKAMNLKENDVSKGFWGTIAAAFKNLFSGGNTSKGFLSNFLDVLILIGVILAGIAVLVVVVKLWRFLTVKKQAGL